MSQIAKYDPLLFKFPKGVITKNTKVTFKVQYFADIKPKIAYFMLKNDADNEYKYLEMNWNGTEYVFEYMFSESGHFWYNFQFVYNGRCEYLNRTFDTRSAVSETKQDDFLQLVTEQEYVCTDSMQGGLIYQIFVDRFCTSGEVKCRRPLIFRDDWGGDLHKNTNNPIIVNLEVFGGNFKGIIAKLDYLKDLGVTVIYLNPIQQANSNHKYNTSDYMKVDDMYGSESDFAMLIREAKSRGMKIVIDGVYNHTGSDSIYFNKDNNYPELGAYQSQYSKYYGWYDFDVYPDKYRSWWGIDTLPSINHNCKEFQNFIAGDGGVLEKFLKLGIAGVRLDVVDEITDEFVQKIEKKVHEFGKDKVVMGEVWEDASTKESYSVRRKYFANNELNSVMNYPIKGSIFEFLKTKDSTSLESTIRMIENNYPKVVRDNLMNFLTTHDTGRFFSELLQITENDIEKSKQLYKIAMALIFTLPGVPSIFYGDEYGMENNAGSSRGCFDWTQYNNDIYSWIKEFSKIRKISCLKDGEIEVLYSEGGKFVFERLDRKNRIVVIINLSDNNFEVNLDGKFKSLTTNDIPNKFVVKQNEFEILLEEK